MYYWKLDIWKKEQSILSTRRGNVGRFLVFFDFSKGSHFEIMKIQKSCLNFRGFRESNNFLKVTTLYLKDYGCLMKA